MVHVFNFYKLYISNYLTITNSNFQLSVRFVWNFEGDDALEYIKCGTRYLFYMKITVSFG